MNRNNRTRGWAITRSAFVGAILGGLFYTAPGFADSGPYVGVGWGRFEEESKLGLPSSENNSAAAFFAGYQIFGVVALEAGYVAFNRLSFDLGGGSVDRVENDSLYARANLLIPLFRVSDTTVSIFGTGGVHRWQAKETTISGGTSVSAEAHDTAPTYGGGVLLQSPRNAALRLDYEVFKDIGKANKVDLNLLSINLLYYF